MVESASVFRFLNTSAGMLLCENQILPIVQVYKFDISPICHPINLTLEGLCHSVHCNHPD